MSQPAVFLTAFAQSLATMSLYGDGHPARERTIDGAFESLLTLQESDPRPRFSFLGQDVIYGEVAMRELGDWGWGARLANAGVQARGVRGVPRRSARATDAAGGG
jgi:hypothetical protein